jgi:hypothetical protein
VQLTTIQERIPESDRASSRDNERVCRWGSGFRVQGSGFRVQGPEFRVQGSVSQVQGSRLRVEDLMFRVRGLVFKISLHRGVMVSYSVSYLLSLE